MTILRADARSCSGPVPAAGAAAAARPTRPCRVLIVIDHLGFPGGVEHGPGRLLLEQLPRMDPAQVTPTLCVLREHHPLADRLAQAGFAPICLGRHKWDPRAVLDLVAVIRRCDADVVHLMGEKAMLLGRIAARWTRRRAIIHLRDTKSPTPLIRFAARRLAPWTDLALGCADAVTELAVHDWAIPPHRARTLLNGINLQRFANPPPDARTRIRAELNIEPDAPVVIVTGRMAPEKGQDLLIRAMTAVVDRCPDARLIIAGGGPTLESCRDLVRQLGLENVVRLPGRRSDIPDLLAAADIAALPSRWGEGLPGAAVEAIAAARPVVAFPVAGTVDVVLHEHTGLVVPQDDVPALADAILRLILEPDLRARLAQQAQQHSRRFAIEDNVLRLQSIYLEVTRAESPERKLADPATARPSSPPPRDSSPATDAPHPGPAPRALSDPPPSAAPTSSRPWLFARIAITLALLVVLALRLDLPALGTSLTSARLDALILLIFLLWSQRYLAALRWWILLRRHNPELGLWHPLRITFTSDFLGHFLPGTIGVEAVRISAMTRATGNLAGTVASIVMDRLLSMGALAAIVLIALALAPQTLQVPPAVAIAGAACLALAIGGGMALVHPRLRSIFASILRGRLGHAVKTRAAKFAASFDDYRGHGGSRLLAAGAALAVLFQSMRILMYMVAAAALGISAPPAAFIIAVPIVIFIAMLPISLGGLGVREAAFMVLLGAAGVRPEEAVAMSLLVFTVHLLCRLPGAFFLAAGSPAFPQPQVPTPAPAFAKEPRA